jgi:predicted transcriptional regulator
MTKKQKKVVRPKEIVLKDTERLSIHLVLSRLEAIKEGILRREIQVAKILEDAQNTAMSLEYEIRELNQIKPELLEEKAELYKKIKDEYGVDLEDKNVFCDFKNGVVGVRDNTKIDEKG